MITAAQAREKTLETIFMTAKEFITNNVEPKIDEATRFGNFNCTVKHTHSPAFQEAVIELLEKEGYTVITDEGHYDINWENHYEKD